MTDNVTKSRDALNEFGWYSIEKFFSTNDLLFFEEAVLALLILQGKKIGEYRHHVADIERSNSSNFEKFQQIYELMESDDKEALYQVQKFLTSSIDARSIFNPQFIELMAGILGSSTKNLLVDGPALFVNRPRTERLLYKWHSEQHYYPKRRKFLNVWIPLFEKKSELNGTMSFREKTHLRDFPFADYQGYDKDSVDKSNYFIQYEIPENFLLDYKEHFCIAEPGDLYVFHKNLVHRSNTNTSNKYSVAIVARVWDPSDDLTLSGSMQATPYGGNISRPNLLVDPGL
jgi:hypothetical protein